MIGSSAPLPRRDPGSLRHGEHVYRGTRYKYSFVDHQDGVYLHLDEELEVITAALWLDSPGYLAVLVTCYPNKPTADVSAAGFASENEQVARVVLAQGTGVEDEVREAMANGGIYVVAPANEARALPRRLPW